MSRVSTSCASGNGAITCRIGSSAKNTVPSGMAFTSPVKRRVLEPAQEARTGNVCVCASHSISSTEKRQFFKMGERLIESRGDKKIALSWEPANEELKDRRLMHSVLPVGLQHGELVSVSQQRAVIACSQRKILQP